MAASTSTSATLVCLKRNGYEGGHNYQQEGVPWIREPRYCCKHEVTCSDCKANCLAISLTSRAGDVRSSSFNSKAMLRKKLSENRSPFTNETLPPASCTRLHAHFPPLVRLLQLAARGQQLLPSQGCGQQYKQAESEHRS
jgi:hypothetical protein